MKLKYYLRGVGTGIIFATLVMTVSSFVHKNNITDEYIIKEAQKLGMVMKEEQSNNGLFNSENTQETEVSQVTEDSQTIENSQMIEDSQMAEDSQITEDIQSTENETQLSESESTSEPEVESQEPVNPEPPANSEQPVNPEPPVSSEPQYVTIVIAPKDNAREVAEKMYAAGLIADSEEFRKFIGANGYAYDLRVGTYSIPMGATYDEICKIITTEQ